MDAVADDGDDLHVDVADVIGRHVELMGRLEGLASALARRVERGEALHPHELAVLDQVGAGLAHVAAVVEGAGHG